MGNKMSDAVREVVVQIAERTGFETVLKHDGTDEFVKNLMFKIPNSPYPLYIRKEGTKTNDAGMPTYFQVAVHPDIFQAKFVEPSKGVEELLNTRTKQNLFSSSNYRGFPVYPSNKEPCGKCYKANNFGALERLLTNLAGKLPKAESVPFIEPELEITPTQNLDIKPKEVVVENTIAAEKNEKSSGFFGRMLKALKGDDSKTESIKEMTATTSQKTKRTIPTTALIIDTPFIDRILNGEKIWEMRSQNCTIRGTIGLIRKGSGQVIGIADLVDCKGPFSGADMLKHQDKHKIPTERLNNPDVAKWNIAWVMENPHLLKQPVKYAHPNGAVKWVKLEDDVQRAIGSQFC